MFTADMSCESCSRFHLSPRTKPVWITNILALEGALALLAFNAVVPPLLLSNLLCCPTSGGQHAVDWCIGTEVVVVQPRKDK